WIEGILDTPAVIRQQGLYDETFIPALAQSLSTRLQANITAEDVPVIYSTCGYEVSVYDDASTWCQMLLPAIVDDNKDIVVESKAETFVKLEISTDLREFYSTGPGIPFNAGIGCKLATSILQSIETVLSKPSAANVNTLRGQLKFGHFETIMFFSGYLGLYNQTGALKAGMTPEQYATRGFRTSIFSQLSANMALEVYRPIDNISNEPRGLIRLLVNEIPVVIPGCGNGSIFCEFSEFKSHLIRRGIDKCDFNACCGVKSCSSNLSSVVFTSNATCPSMVPIE
ncbi:hypothetical protein BGZ65_012056, partial [Modicella reniformis]